METDFTRNSDEQITLNRLLTYCLNGISSLMIKFIENSGLITSFSFQWKMQGPLKLVQVKTFQLSVTVTVYSPLCLRAIYFPLWSKRKHKLIHEYFLNALKNFHETKFAQQISKKESKVTSSVRVQF